MGDEYVGASSPSLPLSIPPSLPPSPTPLQSYLLPLLLSSVTAAGLAWFAMRRNAATATRASAGADTKESVTSSASAEAAVSKDVPSEAAVCHTPLASEASTQAEWSDADLADTQLDVRTLLSTQAEFSCRDEASTQCEHSVLSLADSLLEAPTQQPSEIDVMSILPSEAPTQSLLDENVHSTMSSSVYTACEACAPTDASLITANGCVDDFAHRSRFVSLGAVSLASTTDGYDFSPSHPVEYPAVSAANHFIPPQECLPEAEEAESSISLYDSSIASRDCPADTEESDEESVTHENTMRTEYIPAHDSAHPSRWDSWPSLLTAKSSLDDFVTEFPDNYYDDFNPFDILDDGGDKVDYSTSEMESLSGMEWSSRRSSIFATPRADHDHGDAASFASPNMSYTQHNREVDSLQAYLADLSSSSQHASPDRPTAADSKARVTARCIGGTGQWAWLKKKTLTVTLMDSKLEIHIHDISSGTGAGKIVRKLRGMFEKDTKSVYVSAVQGIKRYEIQDGTFLYKLSVRGQKPGDSRDEWDLLPYIDDDMLNLCDQIAIQVGQLTGRAVSLEGGDASTLADKTRIRCGITGPDASLARHKSSSRLSFSSLIGRKNE